MKEKKRSGIGDRSHHRSPSKGDSSKKSSPRRGRKKRRKKKDKKLTSQRRSGSWDNLSRDKYRECAVDPQPFYQKALRFWTPKSPSLRPTTFKKQVETKGAFLVGGALPSDRFEVTRVVTRDVLQVIDWGSLGSAYITPSFWLRPWSIRNADYHEFCGAPYHEYVTPALALHEAVHLAATWMQTAAVLLCGSPIWWMKIGNQHLLTKWCAVLRSHEREWVQTELFRMVIFDEIEEFYTNCLRGGDYSGYLELEMMFYTVTKSIITECERTGEWNSISKFDTGLWRLRIMPVEPSIRYMPYMQVGDSISTMASRRQLSMCARDLIPMVCFYCVSSHIYI